MKNNQAATSDEVEEIVQRVVGEVVGSIVNDALQLISQRFDEQAKDAEYLQSVVGRVENKPTATTDIVDDHTVQLKQLMAKLA